MVTKSRYLRQSLHNKRERGEDSILNDSQSDWMTIHIPIQNEFVKRLALYKTIENSNIKINTEILGLLSNGKTLIFVRTLYHKVESEYENVLH